MSTLKWRYSLHEEDRRLAFLFFVGWVLSLLMSALFYLYGPLYAPLWYSLTVKSDQIATREWMWVFPGISTLILFVSLWTGRRSNLEHERFLARFSLLAGLALMVLLLIAQLRIIKIVL